MSATLYYFNGRGKAEIIRLIMSAVGIEWTQVDITEKSQFEALKADGKLFFGQLPLIEFEGKQIVQSQAAAHFFARRGNLLGITEDEILKVDVLYEGTRDFNSAFMSYGFSGYKEVLDKAKATSLPKYLPIYNKALADNGSNGFLVGSKLSLADIGFLEPILSIEELMGSEELDPYPEVQKFLNTMKSNEYLTRYLKTKRPKKNDDQYVDTVKAVLS